MQKTADQAGIDKLMQRPSAEIREETKKVSARYKDCWAELAKLLYRIKALRDYEKWKYTTFEAYVEEELGLEARTVRFWLSIYDKLVLQLGVSEEKLKGRAWAKVRYILPVANKGNVDKWLDKAERLSQPEIAATVHEVIEGRAEPVEGSLFTPLSFKVNDDQRKTIETAIAKAKKLSPNDNDADAHALEMICLSFLGDSFEEKRDVLVKMLAKIESVFRVKLLAINTSCPEWKDIFAQAQEVVKKASVEIK
jgi:hypothetical protein